MSTVSRPTPARAREPAETPPAPARGGRRRWFGRLAPILLAAGAYFAWTSLQPAPESAPGAPATAVRTAVVTAGPLEQVVRVAGVTSSIRFVNITAPRQRGPDRMAMILLELAPSGKMVKKGEIIARIDARRLRDHIDDVQAIVVASEADVRKRRAEQKAELATLEQNVTVAKATWRKWVAEARAAEIRTMIDQEILNIGVEETRAAYEQLLEDLEIKKQAHRAELRILELTTERHKRHRDRHVYDLERYTVRAPVDGMVVRQQIFRNGEFGLVQNGDRLHPGLIFLKVMDISAMQIEGKISQVDSNRIKIGQQARIGLDAFPEVRLTGEVYSIGALAKSSRQSPWVRNVVVRVRIHGSHPKLIPDLSAYADVVVAREEKATLVPLAAVHQENGRPVAYVKRGDRFEIQPVELGLRNHLYAAVRSGLSEGDVVALETPRS